MSSTGEGIPAHAAPQTGDAKAAAPRRAAVGPLSTQENQTPKRLPPISILRTRLAARIENLRYGASPESRTGPSTVSRAASASQAAWRTAMGHVGQAGKTFVAGARAATHSGRGFVVERAAPAVGGAAQSAFDTSRAAAHATGQAVAAGARAAARYAREEAGPWLAQALRRLRARLRPAELKQDYRHVLLLAHTYLLDREMESVLFARSAAPLPLRRLHRGGATVAAAERHRPTPRLVFEWALAAVPEPVGRFVFVDLGAGRGRVLLLAAAHDFDRVLGVEHDPEMHNDCEMNIAQYPRSRMKCRDVECLLADASDVPIPHEKTIFYLFGTIEEATVREVMARIALSYARTPRRLYCLCVGLASLAPIEDTSIFQRLRLDRRLQLKIDLLSPYPVAVYRSLA